MAKVERLGRVMAQLKAREMKALADTGGSVVVGYTATYAIHVHENLTAYHAVGQAKFLEEPARTLTKVISDIVHKAVRAGARVIDALLLGGMRLQRESQMLCPVDTGNLRGSAFTRKEA